MMKYCRNCGVELDETMSFCPLCGKSVTDEKSIDSDLFHSQQIENEERLLSDFNELTYIQRRKLFWELSGIILISGMLFTIIIDLIINKSITWSKYSASFCLALFINITLIVFLKKKILILISLSFISTSILLVLLDLYNKSNGWGLAIGIPLSLAFYVIVLILTYLVRSSSQRGINLIAYFLTATGILCLCIEGILSFQVNNRLHLQWGALVLVSVLPVSAILLFIHYRLRRGTDLKRFFHI